MAVSKFDLNMDFNETSLDYARAKLGADHFHQLSVFASRYNALNARRLQGIHGFELTVVPDYLFPSRSTWGAEYSGKAVWTEGAP